VIPIVNGERPVLNKLDDGTTLPNLDTVRNNILGCHNPKQILPECEVPIEYYQPLSVSELWRGPNELRREDRPAARAEWPTSCRRGSHLPRQRRSRPRC